jgi:hypothetical protein
MRRNSWLPVVIMLALTAVIGLLAGYGALRLWRDHAPPPVTPPTVAQVTVTAPAPPTSQQSAPEASSQPRSAKRRIARSNSTTAQRTPSESTPIALRSEPPINFAGVANEPPEPAEATGSESPVKQMARPAEPPAPAPSAANDATLRPQYSVVLDLTRPRTQETLDIESKDLAIVALQACPEKFEIKPGLITIKGPREILIAVSIERLSAGRTQVLLEPTVKTDAGKKLPFTVRNMENVRRQLGQTGETATSQIATWKLEQKSLDDYIRSNRLRTAARDDAARARLDILKKQIPDAEKTLVAMKADYDTAEKMVALAKVLHEKCIVLFEKKR